MAELSVPMLKRAESLVLETLEYISSGFHAAPATPTKPLEWHKMWKVLPSMHRTLNAGGGLAGYYVSRKLMDVLVGEKRTGDKIEKKSLPLFLQPFHGILAYNRFADDPHNQWMRVLHDILPAIGSAAGAIAGSAFFFDEQEKTILKNAGLLDPKNKSKSIEEILKSAPITAVEDFKSYAQGKMFRWWSGPAGIFSSHSGLNILALPFNVFNYGLALNKAFGLCARRKEFAGLAELTGLEFFRVFTTTPTKIGVGPSEALKAMVGKLAGGGRYADAVINEGRIDQYLNAALKPWFGKTTDAAKLEGVAKTLRAKITGLINEAVEQKLDPVKTSKAIQGKLNQLFSAEKIEETLKERGLTRDTITFANNGYAGWMADNPWKASGIAAGGMGALAVGGAAFAKSPALPASAKQEEKKGGNVVTRFINGPVLGLARWLSDAVVNVVPKNRFFSALFLTAGLFFGYHASGSVFGRDFQGNVLSKEKVLKPFRFLHGLCSLDYFAQDSGNRWKRQAMWWIPTFLSVGAVVLGGKLAFRKQEKANEKPEFIEDYIAATKFHNAGKWRWLNAISAHLPSASGMSNLPIPGLNYSITLASTSVGLWDKNVMFPGLNKLWSGTGSTTGMGYKATLDYTARYAARNMSDMPAELPSLCANILEVFPKATKEHVKKLVDAIQAERHTYFAQDGAFDKTRLPALEERLKTMLRGEGFEQTLEKVGLHPWEARIVPGGVLSGIANLLGAREKTDHMGREFQEKAKSRFEARVHAGETPANSVPEKGEQGGKAPPAPAAPLEPPPAPAKNFTERLEKPAVNQLAFTH